MSDPKPDSLSQPTNDTESTKEKEQREKQEKFAKDPLRKKIAEYFQKQPSSTQAVYDGILEDKLVTYTLNLGSSPDSEPLIFTNQHDLLEHINRLRYEEKNKLFGIIRLSLKERQKTLNITIASRILTTMPDKDPNKDSLIELQNKVGKLEVNDQEENLFDPIVGLEVEASRLSYEKRRLKQEIKAAKQKGDISEEKKLIEEYKKTNKESHQVNQKVIALKNKKYPRAQEDTPPSADNQRVEPALAPEQHETKEPLTFEVGYQTRTEKDGPVDENQDAWIANTDRNFYGVFDGMGGMAKGEEASRMASAVIESEIAKIPDTADFETFKAAFREAFITADRAIKERIGYRTGTTASVVAIWKGPSGEQRMLVGHVGDSRVYRLRNGTLTPITIDQNLLYSNQDTALNQQKKVANLLRVPPEKGEERDSALRIFNTRHFTTGLGANPEFDGPIITEVNDLEGNDRYITTCDGIHDNLTDDQIEIIARQYTEPQKLANTLIDESKKAAALRENIVQTLETTANNNTTEADFPKIAQDTIRILKINNELPLGTDETVLVQLIIDGLRILKGEPGNYRTYKDGKHLLFYPRSKDDDMTAIVINVKGNTPDQTPEPATSEPVNAEPTPAEEVAPEIPVTPDAGEVLLDKVTAPPPIPWWKKFAEKISGTLKPEKPAQRPTLEVLRATPLTEQEKERQTTADHNFFVLQSALDLDPGKIEYRYLTTKEGETSPTSFITIDELERFIVSLPQSKRAAYKTTFELSEKTRRAIIEKFTSLNYGEKTGIAAVHATEVRLQEDRDITKEDLMSRMHIKETEAERLIELLRDRHELID